MRQSARLRLSLRTRWMCGFYSGKDWLGAHPSYPYVARGAMDRQISPTVVENFNNDGADPAGQDCRRERRSRPSRALRKGCPGRSRHKGVSGPVRNPTTIATHREQFMPRGMLHSQFAALEKPARTKIPSSSRSSGNRARSSRKSYQRWTCSNAVSRPGKYFRDRPFVACE